MHATLKFSKLVFLVEGLNIQVFFKVLKDLEKSGFENVTLIYFADSPAELPFLSEVEYWMKNTKWTIDVTVAGGAPSDWAYQTGDLHSAQPYRQVPNASSSTGLFASVGNIVRADLSDRLCAKGYQPKMIHWLN
jgi:NAD(P)H-flavin reductase